MRRDIAQRHRIGPTQFIGIGDQNRRRGRAVFRGVGVGGGERGVDRHRTAAAINPNLAAARIDHRRGRARARLRHTDAGERNGAIRTHQIDAATQGQRTIGRADADWRRGIRQRHAGSDGEVFVTAESVGRAHGLELQAKRAVVMLAAANRDAPGGVHRPQTLAVHPAIEIEIRHRINQHIAQLGGGRGAAAHRAGNAHRAAAAAIECQVVALGRVALQSTT